MTGVPNLKPFSPGVSGNPSGLPGRTPGSRTAFSQGFIRDFALVWQDKGTECIRKMAEKSPEGFVAIAARLIPNDVRVAVEQTLPGNLSVEDWHLVQELLAAVKESIPDAHKLPPGEVCRRVREALQLSERVMQMEPVNSTPA
jgi:hypothetical protein